jgi:transcriptional regulator with XRE-family HTH domain
LGKATISNSGVFARLVASDRSGTTDSFGAGEMQALGRQLRRLREDRGWSLKRLSAESGVSVAAIQRVENGSANPSFLTALRLSEALGRSLNEIVEGARNARQIRSFTKGTLQRRANGVVALSDPQIGAVLGSKLLALGPREELIDLNVRAPLFAYILEGSVVVTLANGHCERLQSHDAFHIAGSPLARVTNSLARRALVLCVTDERSENPGERSRS